MMLMVMTVCRDDDWI